MSYLKFWEYSLLFYLMVVPRFVRQALRGEPLTVYGDGRQTRCFLAVSDAVRAIGRLLENPQADGQVFNLGGEQEITIQALAEKVLALTGSASPIQRMPYDQTYAPGFEDMRRRVPNTERLRALTGWQAQKTLEEVLEEVIQCERNALVVEEKEL